MSWDEALADRYEAWSAQMTADIPFYTELVGLSYEGRDEPFDVLRVAPETTILLAAWGTEGGRHLAFAFDPVDFERAFQRVRQAGVPYGDSFHTVGNMKGPGPESGARGNGAAVYVFDPDRHLIEIRCYPDSD